MAGTVKEQQNNKTFSIPGVLDTVAPGVKSDAVKSGMASEPVLTQDFHRLLEAFTNQIKITVPCDGIKFRANGMDQHFVTGVLDHYLCCFAIKVGKKSFGTIYFARETQFTDSELTILENMAAGLVLPLCHLSQISVSDNKIQASETASGQQQV